MENAYRDGQVYKCTKRRDKRGRSAPHEATMFVTVINCLRLFVVVICVRQCVNSSDYGLIHSVFEAIVVAMATCNLVC